MEKIANTLGRGGIVAALATLLVLATIMAAASPGEAQKKGKGGVAFAKNADKLDNKDSTEFLGSSVYTKQSSVQGVAGQIKEANLNCNAGDVMLNGGYSFGSGPEILQDTVFNNTYFLAWRSGAQQVNAVLYVTCANQ